MVFMSLLLQEPETSQIWPKLNSSTCSTGATHSSWPLFHKYMLSYLYIRYNTIFAKSIYSKVMVNIWRIQKLTVNIYSFACHIRFLDIVRFGFILLSYRLRKWYEYIRKQSWKAEYLSWWIGAKNISATKGSK